MADSQHPAFTRAKDHGDDFPYVVVRFAACAYGKAQVEYVPGIPMPRTEGTIVQIPERKADSPEGLAFARREALIDALLGFTARSRIRMCAVFGPNDAVYVEPDGTVKKSNERPSGGVIFHDPPELPSHGILQ